MKLFAKLCYFEKKKKSFLPPLIGFFYMIQIPKIIAPRKKIIVFTIIVEVANCEQ